MPGGLVVAVVMFALYAFLGWALEVAYRSVTQRKLVNPGFLHGPFIPLYGFGALFVVILSEFLVGWHLALRILSYGLALTVLEYVVGTLVENTLRLRLWDYSNNPLNLHGRVCFAFSVVWAALAFGFARLVHPVVSTGLVSMDRVTLRLVALAFVAYLGVDMVASIASARAFRAAMARLHGEYLRLTDGEIDRILAGAKRLREAFPHLNTQLFRTLNQRLHRVVDARLQGGYQMLATELERRKPLEEEYLALVGDILEHPEFLRLRDFFHHDSSIYEHTRRVSYLSYSLCKQLGLNYRSAARGGLLHDFFLYDWRNHDVPDLPRSKFHGIEHPKIALANAEAHFVLDDIERDCIAKHMWPLTMAPPRFGESFIVSLVDKYLASTELLTRRPRKDKRLHAARSPMADPSARREEGGTGRAEAEPLNPATPARAPRKSRFSETAETRAPRCPDNERALPGLRR